MKLPEITKILKTFGIELGDPSSLEDFSIRVENAPWMPLTIESIGRGPNGLLAISVCHYNSAQQQDPEMMLEVTNEQLFPYALQTLLSYQEVYVVDDAGKVAAVRTEVRRDTEAFARMWDRNLHTQGFGKAANISTAK